METGDSLSLRWCISGENSLGLLRLFFEVIHQHPMETLLMKSVYVYYK